MSDAGLIDEAEKMSHQVGKMIYGLLESLWGSIYN
jgi:hypothetical protein